VSGQDSRVRNSRNVCFVFRRNKDNKLADCEQWTLVNSDLEFTSLPVGFHKHDEPHVIRAGTVVRHEKTKSLAPAKACHTRHRDKLCDRSKQTRHPPQRCRIEATRYIPQQCISRSHCNLTLTRSSDSLAIRATAVEAGPSTAMFLNTSKRAPQGTVPMEESKALRRYS
jgi:hypothetical protein